MIDQGEMFEIANPCRGVCEVNNKGYCKGCLRKREERFHWNEFTPFQKQMIVNLCGRRRNKALTARKQAEWLALQNNPNQQEASIPQLDMFIVSDSQEDIDSASDAINPGVVSKVIAITDPTNNAPLSVFPEESAPENTDSNTPTNEPVLTSSKPDKQKKEVKKTTKKKPESKKDPGQFDLF